MIYTPLTKKAMKIAYRAHLYQSDRTGLPYIFHPFHLAEQMTDELTTAAALLHDVVEDTNMTFDDLRKEGIPEEVISALVLLTHEEGVPYYDYVRMTKNDPIAAAVKRADLLHNSDISRLSTVTGADLQRMEKYKKALDILDEEQ